MNFFSPPKVTSFICLPCPTPNPRPVTHPFLPPLPPPHGPGPDLPGQRASPHARCPHVIPGTPRAPRAPLSILGTKTPTKYPLLDPQNDSNHLQTLPKSGYNLTPNVCAIRVISLSGTRRIIPTRRSFPVPWQCLLNFFLRLAIHLPNPGIFGSLQKRGFQTCMGHEEGKVPLRRSYSRGRSGILGVFSADFDGASQDFDLVSVRFSAFQPRTPLKP